MKAVIATSGAYPILYKKKHILNKFQTGFFGCDFLSTYFFAYNIAVNFWDLSLFLYITTK